MAQLIRQCPTCGNPMWVGPPGEPQRPCWSCQQDRELVLKLAVDRTRDGVIDAARQFEIAWRWGSGIDAPTCDAAEVLATALADYDAAVAEHRAHDDRVQP